MRARNFEEEIAKVTRDKFERRFNEKTGSIAWAALRDIWLGSDGLRIPGRVHLSRAGTVALTRIEAMDVSPLHTTIDPCASFLYRSLNGFLEAFCGASLMVHGHGHTYLWVSYDGTEVNFPGLCLTPLVSDRQASSHPG